MVRSRLYGSALLAGLMAGLSACEPGARSDREAEAVELERAPAGTGAEADARRAAIAPDATAPAHYRLTRDSVRRYAEASKGLRKLAEEDPGPMRRLRAREEARRARSLEETASRLEEEPAVRAAIEAAGLSAHEYALITITLSEAILVQQALAQGSIDRPPPGVSAENVEFVRVHRDEISRLLAEAARAP